MPWRLYVISLQECGTDGSKLHMIEPLADELTGIRAPGDGRLSLGSERLFLFAFARWGTWWVNIVLPQPTRWQGESDESKHWQVWKNAISFHILMWSSKWLTHWGRDKMAAIFQTTFSNTFSWMKIYEFRLRFHKILFLRLQLTIFQHCFR